VAINPWAHHRIGGVSGGKMNIKTKNVLTAVLLFVVAICIYAFAVYKAMSQ